MIQFRRWLATRLARLARRIDCTSPAVYAFWADRMMEQVITGNSFIKISGVPPEEVIIDAAGIHSRSPAAGSVKP